MGNCNRLSALDTKLIPATTGLVCQRGRKHTAGSCPPGQQARKLINNEPGKVIPEITINPLKDLNKPPKAAATARNCKAAWVLYWDIKLERSQGRRRGMGQDKQWQVLLLGVLKGCF